MSEEMEPSQEVCSVVTDTTRDSDETSQELPTLWKGLYGYKEKDPLHTLPDGTCSPVQRYPATDIENGESPLFPVQQLTKVHFSGNNNSNTGTKDATCTQDTVIMHEEDAMSEFSQPLIPLRKPGEIIIPSFRTTSKQRIEDTMVEASQSLLPQTAAERSQLPDFLSTRLTPGAIPNPSSVYAKSARNKPKFADKAAMQDKIPETQSSSTSSKGDNLLWASQQREMSQSQGSASAATDAVIARLERLVESLGTATRKQKRVMEIAVNQCVSKLQDNVNRRLKSKTLSPELQETLKKILKTTQSCLSKLLAHHKKEQCLLAGSRHTATSQQAGRKKSDCDSDSIHQSTLAELRQRQRELQSLLKRQQNLLDRFKELMRNQPGIKGSGNHGNFQDGKSPIPCKEKAVKSNEKRTGRPKALCIENPDTSKLPEGGKTTYEICPTDPYSQHVQDSVQLHASGNSQSTGNLELSGHNKSSGHLPSSGNIPLSGNMPSSGNVPSSGNLPFSGNIPPSGNMPSSGKLLSSGNLQSSGNLPPSGKPSSIDNLQSSGHLPPSENLPSSGSLPASRNITSSENNPTYQNLQLDEAIGNNSKSTEATGAEQSLGNISVTDDCEEDNGELAENTSEPSQDLTTIPDTQEPYSQLTDKTCSPSVNSDDNVVNLQSQIDDNLGNLQRENKPGDQEVLTTEDDGLKQQTHMIEEVEPGVLSKRIPKRNLPWSPDQGTSQTSKNQKAEKTSKESPKQRSEMLWLNMLHQKKDAGTQHASSKIKERKDIENIEHSEDVMKNKAMQKRITNPNQSLSDDKNFFDKVQQKNVSSETRSSNIGASKGTELNMNFDANASKFMPTSEPLNSPKTRDTCTIPLVSAQNTAGFQPRESFLMPAATCFISPPRIHMEADISSNVSPTATSMSSDVFLVKAKELNRRMKMRERLAAEQAANNSGKITTHIEKTNNTQQQSFNRSEKTTVNFKNAIITQPQGVNRNVKGPANIETSTKPQQQICKAQPTIFNVIGNTQSNTNEPLRKESMLTEGNNRDTISEAIDSVIAKSRNVPETSKNADHKTGHMQGEKLVYSSILTRPGVGNASTQGFVEGAYGTSKLHSAQAVNQTKTTVEMASKGTGLPSIKQLLQAGVITAGKLCLSVHAQGILHKASLTPLGKIRTQQGMVFMSPMQWLSTLTDGETKKKRGTYRQVLYKGRSLLDICMRHQNKKGTTGQPIIIQVDPAPSSSTPVYRSVQQINQSHQKLDCFPARKSEKAVQVEMEVCSETSPGNKIHKRRMGEAEAWLNSLLSSSVVRLLTDRDLVPCDDLPDNFWTEDYSKVRLGVEVWDTVDKW